MKSLLPLLVLAFPQTPPTRSEAEAPVPRSVPGEVLPADSHGPSWVESMQAVLERERVRPKDDVIHRARNGAQGVWVVPSRKDTRATHSGEHSASVKWGDTRIGIGFGEPVDVRGAWITAHGGEGAWTSGVAVVGYRDGAEVARSAWFREIGLEPRWFAMDLEGVDRIEFVAEPVVEGAGFWALDDLTFECDGDAAPVVVGFDDLAWRTELSGSGYGGLTWEVGTGDFSVVHEPATPPGTKTADDVEAEGIPGFLGGLGTAPVVVDEFVGPTITDTGAGWLPPDTCGAVGPDHFVAVVNMHMSVYDKANGNRLISTSMQSFFNVSGNVGDPRAAFDEHSGRWIVHAGDFSSGVWLAVSTTSDPTGSWFKTFINLSQGSDVGAWPDYPTLGVDDDGIYLGAYMVGNNFLMSLFAIDKAPLVAASPSLGTVSAWRQLPWEGALQPCVTHGSAPGEYVVSRTGSSGTTLRVRRIDGPLTAPSLVEVGFATVPAYNQPASAPAMGSTVNLSTVDNRLMNAVYRDGSIWAGHNITRGGRAACRWYELDAQSASLVQSGNIEDPTRSYFFPAVAVNAEGEVVVSFSGSSPSEFAGVWYAGRRPGDPPGELSVPEQLKQGEEAYNQAGSGTNRWGDYSLTSVDPSDDLTLWTIQEYARSGNRWGTWIGAFQFDSGPDTLGTRYCSPAVPNSSGSPGRMLVLGSAVVADDDLTLVATDLPPEQNIGYFVMGQGMNVFTPPGSAGPICVTPGLVRYLPPVSNTHEEPGGFQRSVGTSGPQSGLIGAGSTWNFQAWHRDQLFGTSNLTDAISIVFQ